MNNVSVEKKREFMKWVLCNLEPRMRADFSILYTFYKNSKFTERVHFVENARKYPYGVEISADCSDGESFAFYKPNVTVEDVDAAFDHFKNSDAEIYVQLNFRGKYSEPLYMEVLEDDTCSLETYLDGEDYENIVQLVSNLENLSKSQLIDYALDTRDKNLFDKLVAN